MLKQYKLTMDTINRLQFRHHNEIFDTREEAIEYIYDKIKEEGEGLASEQNSPYSYSLFAEPTVLRYKNEEEETGCNFKKGPHIMLVIGSETNDTIYHDRNRFCIIDIDKTEDEIKNLEEELAKAVKSLTLAVFDTSTLDLHVEKTDDGTFLSGDVKTAETHVFDGIVKENNLMIVPFDDEAGPEGLFIYVDLTYDEASETFTFVVTNADGTLKKQSVKLPNNYLVSGEYKKSDESLHLHMKDGTDVVVNCEELIAEWAVEGEASKTPIVLTREEVAYDGTPDHHHVEPWQDVLRADVRISDMNTNILEKTSDGRYLFVDGKASNILYYWNGERTNVEDQLNKLNKMCRVSPDNDNIIKYIDEVGFFASAKLDYITSENKLVFTTSSVNGEQIVKEIRLNTVDVIEDIKYDPVTEELVIKYRNDKGEIKILRVPLSGLIDEWTVLNTGHSVKLNRQRNVSGADILTADVNISGLDNNILEERGEGDLHTLYVRGTADNIQYRETTVEGALDDLEAEDESINEKLQNEIDRSTTEDEKIETTIGSGFSTDAHETVTYKFEELQNQVNSEAEKLQNEIDRSEAKDTEHDGRLDEQQAEIEAISADSANSLKDIINNDHSINVDKTDPVKPVISVNLSEHQPYNTIRLEGDGLYNFIDLRYDSDTNKLTFVRSENGSTENVEKEIQLNSVPFDIRYDKDREVLIITYHTSEGDKTVEIDLHDLIHDEWTVQDTETIELNKSLVVSGGPDVLTAKVKICHHEDNAIEEHNDGIYVHSYSGEIADLGSRIDTVSGDVITEKARAEEAENNLANSIATEKDRAIAAENGLHDEIEAERRRAESADTALYNAIEDERRRAEAADLALQDAIDDEIARATAAETNLSHLIDDEAEKRISGDTLLRRDLEAEITRSTTQDQELRTNLASEQTARIAEDQRLYGLIVDEAIRATNADEVLDGKINDEAIARVQADAILETKISGETAAREAKDAILDAKIDHEIERLTSEDQRLTNALQQEITDRQQGDAELAQQILDATLVFSPANNEFVSNGTIEFNNYETNDNIVEANVILQGSEDNIIKVGSGIYATVHMSYDVATNKLRLTTSAGSEEFQLAGATVIDNLYYDNESGEIVIVYHDGSGNVQTVRFPASELFNEWIVNNPSEKSAVELTKTRATEQGQPDELKARVLITDDRDNDGKPDEGSDNVIEIRNNGLYVCGSAMTEAQDIAKCVQNEIKVFEKAVIGHIIGEECGSGYTYEPNAQATYINSAISFDNADFILDQSIKNVEIKVDEAIEDIDCVDKKSDKIYEFLYGASSALPDCGEGASYKPYQGSCVISGATSFMEADMMLNDQICEILTMWVSGKTCSTESTWVEDGKNRKITTDVRLSRGRFSEQTDDDVYITDLTGDYIDPTNHEFTDTNVLRIACIEEGPSGTTPSIDSMQNGIYLSNAWDCGLYYDEVEDADAIAAASAAGYKTDQYRTDTSPSASSFNYMNNVRQRDTLC